METGDVWRKQASASGAGILSFFQMQKTPWCVEYPFRPMLCQRLAVLADDLETVLPGHVPPDLEARAVDDAVHLAQYAWVMDNRNNRSRVESGWGEFTLSAPSW